MAAAATDMNDGGRGAALAHLKEKESYGYCFPSDTASFVEEASLVISTSLTETMTNI